MLFLNIGFIIALLLNAPAVANEPNQNIPYLKIFSSVSCDLFPVDF